MGSITTSRFSRKRSLDFGEFCSSCDQIDAVRKEELQPGDWVLVTTRNSEYVIGRDHEGRIMVSGGWFDLHGSSPTHIGVAGCTFGGQAIHTKLLAAPGLFLEFNNQVRTTRIQTVRHYRGSKDSSDFVC